VAQRALAGDLTARVHGEAETKQAVRVSQAAFSREPISDPEVLETLFAAVDHFEFTEQDLAGGAMGIAVVSGQYTSNGEARRAIAQGGLSINDERVKAPEDAVPAPIAGRYLVLRSGKKSLRIGRIRS
jgi:tyrosyl-tRNA synthetase